MRERTKIKKVLAQLSLHHSWYRVPATPDAALGRLFHQGEDVIRRWKEYPEDLLNLNNASSTVEAESVDDEVD